MSELGNLQIEFAVHVGRLLKHADGIALGVTLGEAYRSDEQAHIHALGSSGRSELGAFLRTGDVPAWDELAKAIENNVGSGIRRSLHTQRLAIDIQLFKLKLDGEWEYMSKSEDYKVLGEWWEACHPLARWGGRFGDGCHFSFEYKGVK